jgi:hypothetical protein
MFNEEEGCPISRARLLREKWGFSSVPSASPVLRS